jgi:ATP-dependent DNA helicase RecG
MSDTKALALTSPIADVPGVRDQVARDLATLGLRAIGQLLVHLPSRHEHEEAEAPMSELVPDHIVSARGEITACKLSGYGKKSRFQAVLSDGTGRVDLVWFNAPYLRGKLHPGLTLRVQGKAKTYNNGLQIANPKFEILTDDAEPADEKEARLRPIYPASERVPTRTIEQTIEKVLPIALPLIEDHLTEVFRKERDFPMLSDAYRMMHAPQSEEEVAHGRRRLAYDELLMLQLGVAMKRYELRDSQRAPALRASPAVTHKILGMLPFTLTGAQQRVVDELSSELTRDIPANRLVQGDVGSGKTMVALYAMLLAVESGHQAAMMAPTEILAEQHYESIRSVLAEQDVRVELLTGSVQGLEREAMLGRLEDGTINILIGTHALLTEHVRFNSLAVAVIDEQHRFGVEQRATLRTKGEDESGTTPHVVVMTATPIPRTVSITLFGDLDVSVIDELPPGRQPIETTYSPPEEREAVYAIVRKHVEAGEQAYVVAPAIESETGVLVGARDIAKELETGYLEGLRVALVHGKLKRHTREHIMERFRRGLIDVLVATTVIEVGVDVANASVMVIEQADRFGLAQLHQLRGRVGRGTQASKCVLVSSPATTDGIERLKIMTKTGDGFRIAERDFEIRGPGEIFGSRQSGLPPFRVADLLRDTDLLAKARIDAQDWILRSPRLECMGEKLLLQRVLKTHGRWLGLGDTG